jgi:hypothetical protein
MQIMTFERPERPAMYFNQGYTDICAGCMVLVLANAVLGSGYNIMS